MQLPRVHKAYQQQASQAHDPWYDSAKWRKLRLYVLKRDGVCQGCKVRPATVCDHIIPRDKCDDPYDSGNLQGLCNSCHNRKINAEKRGELLFQQRPEEPPPRAR